jgi:flavin reductase (NADH)
MRCPMRAAGDHAPTTRRRGTADVTDVGTTSGAGAGTVVARAATAADSYPDAPLRVGFVEAMAGLASGVTIVTTVDAAGRPAGLTTTSTVSVSADPPIVSIAVGRNSRTLTAVRGRGAFCVSILRPSGRDAAQLFASRTDDKFREVAWEAGAGGLPWFPELSSHMLHCEVMAWVPAGDHAVLLGEVLTIDRGRPHSGRERNLLYWRRQWLEVG